MPQRHLTALFLLVYVLFCAVCLSWSADSFVRTLRHSFFYLMDPVTVPALAEMETWGSFGRHAARVLRLDQSYRNLERRWTENRLDEKRLRALEAENRRLAGLLGLEPHRGYAPLAARVLARDPNDWFHGVLVQNGRTKGVRVSDPVVALQGDREVLVGQVVEVFEDTSRVLLVTDPLSAVSARVARTGEQGAVEGQGTNRLMMNYLYSDSQVLIGDEVVTAGLGRVFPEGVFVGTVEAVEGEPNESFKRARLKPALRLNNLEEVLVLKDAEAAP